MIQKILISLLFLTVSFAGLSASAVPEVVSVSGIVVDASDGTPVAGVVLKLGNDYLWTTSGLEGEFEFTDVQPGDYIMEATCLGYVTMKIVVDARKDIHDIKISMISRYP